MKLFKFLLRRSRSVVVLAVLVSLVNGLSSTLLLYWINRLIAGASNNTPIGYSLSVYLILLMLVFASGVAAQVLLVRLTAAVVHELRITLAHRILALPLEKLESLGTNRLYATLTQDVGAIANTLGALPMLSFHLAIIIGGLSYLAWLSVKWLAAVLIVIFIAVSVYEVLAGRARCLMKEYRREQDELYRHFDVLLHGTKELKLCDRRRDHFIGNALGQTAVRLMEKYQAAYSVWALGANWANLLAFLLVGAFALLYSTGADIALPVLTAYVLTLLFLRAHFGGALNLIPALVQGEVALKKIDALGLTDSRKASEAQLAKTPGSDWRYLELQDIRFRYPKDDDNGAFIVGPLSVRFKPGEIVFLTGGNGSGKSTFGKLVTGLYQAESGRIRLNEEFLNADNIAWYRQHFCAVFSDFFLFDELLPEKPEQFKQEIEYYLSQLELTHKVNLLDQRLSTLNLSGGQRKRLALLNAYLQDRAIYLFDEWAADQDPHFKKVFYRQLLPQLKTRGKTVLVISHDDRYFDVADRVLKFEEGQLCTNELTPTVAF